VAPERSEGFENAEGVRESWNEAPMNTHVPDPTPAGSP